MTAISSTGFRDAKDFSFGPVPLKYENGAALVKASANCRQGGLAAISAGYYAPATAATGLRIMGKFERHFDNSAGTDGAALSDGTTGTQVRSGVFFYACGTSADAITQANVGAVCYAIDDQTVGLTDGGGTRSPAGIVVAFDSVLNLPAVAVGPHPFVRPSSEGEPEKPAEAANGDDSAPVSHETDDENDPLVDEMLAEEGVG